MSAPCDECGSTVETTLHSASGIRLCTDRAACKARQQAPAGGSERMSEEDLGRCERLILRDSQAGPDRMETYRMVLAEARRARKSEERLTRKLRAQYIQLNAAQIAVKTLGEETDAEIAALRERAEGTEKRLDRLLRWFRGEGRRRLPGQGDVEDYLIEQAEDLSDRAMTAEADRDRLREIIRNAPHEDECPMWTEYRMESGYDERCDCWKAAALKEEKP